MIQNHHFFNSSDDHPTLTKEEMKIWRNKITWKRISEIYPDWTLFGDDITTDDICTGYFDNPVLYSNFLSILQDSREAIIKWFTTNSVNSWGIYKLVVHVDGSPWNIVIDDYVPYFETSFSPAFIGTKSKNIWALLLEKAWAKVCGNYRNAYSKNSSDFLSFLTPYPVKVQLHKKFSEDKQVFLWNYLQTAFSNQYWITTEAIDDQEKWKDIGIIPNNVYMWKEWFQFSSDKNTIRLILVKNSSSKLLWKGEWNNDSSKWNENTKINAKFNSKEDNDFYVTYEEYLRLFESSTICICTPEFEKITYLKVNQPKDAYRVLRLDLFKSSEVIIKITQPLFMKSSPAKLRFVVNKIMEEEKDIEESIYYIKIID